MACPISLVHVHANLPFLLHAALPAAAAENLLHIVYCLQDVPEQPEQPQMQSRALPSQETRVRGAAGYLAPVSHPPLGPGAAEAFVQRPEFEDGQPEVCALALHHTRLRCCTQCCMAIKPVHMLCCKFNKAGYISAGFHRDFTMTFLCEVVVKNAQWRRAGP